jgi:hypothetical protein
VGLALNVALKLTVDVPGFVKWNPIQYVPEPLAGRPALKHSLMLNSTRLWA